ncbi:hypothetical protein C8N47_104198 [Mangrovibacterium marinum]|uniref:Uncharacterized protein n=1 Tax=Mangrovibacterium marinum TaxID=1639118 RepID=A0A2T5C4C6_9BACT|nr:hypothetical protein C8N47_104198 [Mangrovibacterium marinum]
MISLSIALLDMSTVILTLPGGWLSSPYSTKH